MIIIIMMIAEPEAADGRAQGQAVRGRPRPVAERPRDMII